MKITFCSGMKRDGTPCKSMPLRGKQFCRNHDPEKSLRSNSKRQPKKLPKNALAVLKAQLMGYAFLTDEQIDKIADRVVEKLGASFALSSKHPVT